MKHVKHWTKSERRIDTSDFPAGDTWILFIDRRKYKYWVVVKKTACTTCVERFEYSKKRSKYDKGIVISYIPHNGSLSRKFIEELDEIQHAETLLAYHFGNRIVII